MNFLELPLFQSLSDQELEQMKTSGCLRTASYKKNDIIFSTGSTVSEIGIVLSGSVNVENIDFWGNKSILGNMNEGHIFAETYALCREPMMVDAVAASNCTTVAKVVWVNCANLLNSKGIEYVAREYASLLIGGNAQLLTSTMNWMTGEENGVVIDSKSMSAETLTVPAKAIMLLGLLFTIVVPLAFIVAGIAITLVRRRR